MAKLFVMRWVVPLIVSTPTAATATQNRATSALWRSTKRVSVVIATSGFPGRRKFPPTLESLSPATPARRPATGGTCRYHRGSSGRRRTPGGVGGSSPGGGRRGPAACLRFCHDRSLGGVAALAPEARAGQPGLGRGPGRRAHPRPADRQLRRG